MVADVWTGVNSRFTVWWAGRGEGDIWVYERGLMVYERGTGASCSGANVLCG